MRILALITAAEPVDAILAQLGRPTAAPTPLSPARGPPQPDLGFDTDPGFDLDQDARVRPDRPRARPGLDFDRSADA
jgi:hypothetical protein